MPMPPVLSQPEESTATMEPTPLVEAKPVLRSTSQTSRQDYQFKDFGVLNDGAQSKASLLTSVTLNVVCLLIALILGAAAKKTMDRHRLENLTYVTPVKIKPPEPIRAKIPPPKPIAVPKDLKLVEPKILKPEVKLEAPKPVPMKPMEKPLPAVAPAPPKAVVAAAAPKPVTVNLGQSASVVNHDQHPTAVALGSQNNPIAASNRAPSSVSLGQRGLAGMPAGNTGGGPPATAVRLGSGQPGGSLNGSGSRGVVGVRLGVNGGTPGGHGNGVGSRPETVQLGQNQPPPHPNQMQAQHAPARSVPQVIYKPRPVYTAEATALHLEGTVSVRIRVSANGAVSVIGVTRGLGHGLDESAIRAVEATRFKPAMDAAGNPTDWEGVVNVSFQMAG